MTKKIKAFQAGDNHITFSSLISQVMIGRNNKATYLTLVLQDDSGTIDAKLWNAKPEQVESLKMGCVVEVTGDVIRYGEELQLKIEKIDIVSTDPEMQIQYLKQSPLSVEQLQAGLQSYIDQLNDEAIALIVSTLFERHMQAFLRYPAASRNHHEYVSGLAYHTLCMLKMAEAVCGIHPSLNKDFLYGGILLHDLGKIIELSGPVVPEYTLEGKLLGHISIGANLVTEAAKELGLEGESVTILKHLVLSHHGKMEFGSPVLPQIREAEVIYMIDNLDAKINMLDKALENVEPGHFTKRIFPLDNRSFYKPKEK